MNLLKVDQFFCFFSCLFFLFAHLKKLPLNANTVKEILAKKYLAVYLSTRIKFGKKIACMQSHAVPMPVVELFS